MEAARYFRVVSIFISYEMWYSISMLIEVTKLNDDKVAINSDLIEIIETTPDTVITLNTGRKLIVKESRQELRNLVNFHS
jgi:flagellar protein FlbD